MTILQGPAHIAALMRQHGVSTIYTRDRDFRRFDGIKVEDEVTLAVEAQMVSPRPTQRGASAVRLASG